MASLFFLLLKAPIKTGLKVPEEEPEKQSVAQDIRETLQLLKNPRMVKLLPLAVLSSFSQAIFASLFVPLMTDTIKANPQTEDWDEATRNTHCLLAYIGLGVGEIVGGLCIGKIIDKIGNKASLFLCLILVFVATATALAFIMTFSFTL